MEPYLQKLNETEDAIELLSGQLEFLGFLNQLLSVLLDMDPRLFIGPASPLTQQFKQYYEDYWGYPPEGELTQEPTRNLANLLSSRISRLYSQFARIATLSIRKAESLPSAVLEYMYSSAKLLVDTLIFLSNNYDPKDSYPIVENLFLHGSYDEIIETLSRQAILNGYGSEQIEQILPMFHSVATLIIQSRQEIDKLGIGTSQLHNITRQALTTYIAEVMTEVTTLSLAKQHNDKQISTEPVHNEIKDTAKVDAWRQAVNLTNLSVEGEQRTVTTEIYDVTNSSPTERTGLFSAEILSQLSDHFFLSWGLHPQYSEGYINLALLEPGDDRFDPPSIAKAPRGITSIDHRDKRVLEALEAVKLAEQVDGIPADLEGRENHFLNQGWERFWTPESTALYFAEGLTHPEYTVRTVSIDGRIVSWVITYEVAPEEKLEGRSIILNGKRIDSVLYIDTIGWSMEARFDSETTGNIKEKVTVEKIVKMLIQEGNGVLLTRMNLGDERVIRFAMRFGGFTPLSVVMDGSPEVVTVPDFIAKGKKGILVAKNDPTRGFFLRKPRRSNLRIESNTRDQLVIENRPLSMEEYILQSRMEG